MINKPTAAILARTNRALAPFESLLVERGVPFHYINRAGFFSQPEIQQIVAYLGSCIFPANYLLSTIFRSDFHPTKYLPRTKIAAKFKEIKESDPEVSYWKVICETPQVLVDARNLEALQNFKSFIHSLTRYRDLSASEAIKKIMGSLKVGDYYSEGEWVDNDPLENLATLIKMAEKHGSIKEFLDYSRRVAAASKKKSGVALGTVHSAKGLQFQKVFMVSVNDGILPHAKSSDLQEERAIYFVGCSRAEKELTISYSGIPSGFLVKYTQKEKAHELDSEGMGV